ncbi:MAG TPA: cellulase family glycosylhydrolase [Anaerolineae bacterium]|nr:cellulase family glycosylhydrolase [Anaerolineae bacterium]
MVPESGPAEGGSARVAETAQTPTQSLFVPLVSQSNRPGPDTRISIQMYAATDEQVAEAGEAGAARVRIPLSWASVEPANTSPSEYRWSTHDLWFERLSASGKDLILTIEGNPTWAATFSGGPIDKVPISEFVEFVVAAVERYSAPPYNVRLWEFYNEPDNGDPLWAVKSGLGYWGYQPEAYADMLAAVYQPIKQVDPEAQVLLGGIAFDFWPEDGGPFVPEFLDRVLQHGGGAYFDILNFHYYPTAFAYRWAPYGPGLIGKTTFLRDKLAAYGLNKPAICTEAGVENVNTGTDEIQSRYIPILYAETMAADLLSLSWFMLVDQDLGYWKTGLLYADLTRKPAFYAYQTVAALLGEASYLGALSTAEKGTDTMEAYRFLASGGQKPFTVAWTNDGLAYPLTLSGRRVLVVDKYGLERWAYDVADGRLDGVTLVQVGSSPVYLYPEP